MSVRQIECANCHYAAEKPSGNNAPDWTCWAPVRITEGGQVVCLGTPVNGRGCVSSVDGKQAFRDNSYPKPVLQLNPRFPGLSLVDINHPLATRAFEWIALQHDQS